MSTIDPGARAAADGARSGLLRWPGGELDLRSAQVRRGRQLLSLDRSSYEVLLALLLRAGQVLGKDDLLEAAWPGRVVSENSLAKAISRLRRELGEEAGAPLQSVHGYGYRWAGDVQWVDVERSAAPVEPADHDDWIDTEVPRRAGWIFRRVLGRGARSLVLLAESSSGEPPRAIKIGLGEDGLRHVRREVALHRYLAAIDRRVPGLAPALGWQLDEPPSSTRTSSPATSSCVPIRRGPKAGPRRLPTSAAGTHRPRRRWQARRWPMTRWRPRPSLIARGPKPRSTARRKCSRAACPPSAVTCMRSAC